MRKIIFNFEAESQDITSVQDDEIEKNNGKKDSIEEMFDYINYIMDDKDYGIGVHSAQGKNIEDILSSIMKNGLELGEREGILSTVSSFDIHTQIKQEYLKQQIIGYSYGRPEETKHNIIVLVPSIISNSQGKQIYLGFPPYDIECAGNNYRKSCVLDSICVDENNKGRIPAEFILGYYTNGNNGVTFIKNPNYFKLLSVKKKDELFNNIEARLHGKYKTISEAVISGDSQTLEEMSNKEQQIIAEKIKEGKKRNILERGLNSELAENLSRSYVKINQDDSATQALYYLERKREKEHTEKQIIRGKKRKILIELCKDVRLSDLTKAKQILREGIQEPEKANEGKEI